MPRSKVIPFTLKSITNACGTTDFNSTTYLYWIGARLSLDNFWEGKVYCAGEQMVVPFHVLAGNVSPGTTFHLKVGKVGNTASYQTVASQTTLEAFKYTIPSSMEGDYEVRVTTDEFTSSGVGRFFVRKTPTATVSIADQTASEMEYGKPVYINYNMTGGGPWELTVDGKGSVTATNSPSYHGYYLAQGTVFQLKSVSNACGYGTVSGNVSVTVKPKIVVFEPEKITLCSEETIRVKYHVGGDIPSGGKIGFYLKDREGTRFKLPAPSAMIGNASFAVPDGFVGGYGWIVCYISGTAVLQERQITINKTPEIELVGNTTINAGETATIMVRSTKMGNVPLEAVLSDGMKTNLLLATSGNAFINVKPAGTTVYRIVSATGSCGSAKIAGSATVNVNPPAARTLQITRLNKDGVFCEKDTIQVFYASTGTFTSGNQFSLQLYDVQGKLVQTLNSGSKESPVRVVIPAGFSTSEFYRMRLHASDAGTASGDYQGFISFSTRATAAFTSSTALLDTNRTAKAVVVFTGPGPWQYSYGNDLGSINRYASKSPDTLLIVSKESSAYFKLLSVSNGCGPGTISEPSTIRVEIITGVEEPGNVLEPITFGPNPTNGHVLLHFLTASRRKVSIYNVAGLLILQKTVSDADVEIDMQQYVTGSYLVKIEYAKGQQVLRIVKH